MPASSASKASSRSGRISAYCSARSLDWLLFARSRQWDDVGAGAFRQHRGEHVDAAFQLGNFLVAFGESGSDLVAQLPARCATFMGAKQYASTGRGSGPWSVRTSNL
jgi:hypothetical protein